MTKNVALPSFCDRYSDYNNSPEILVRLKVGRTRDFESASVIINFLLLDLFESVLYLAPT